jgi:hypothetical protein
MRAPLALPVSEKPYAGWVERVAYQMMDHVLKAGWTPDCVRDSSAVLQLVQVEPAELVEFGGLVGAKADGNHDLALPLALPVAPLAGGGAVGFTSGWALQHDQPSDGPT